MGFVVESETKNTGDIVSTPMQFEFNNPRRVRQTSQTCPMQLATMLLLPTVALSVK